MYFDVDNLTVGTSRSISMADANVDLTDINANTQYRSDLQKTTNGDGASLVNIEDSAAQFTSDNVEGALTESIDAAQSAQVVADAAIPSAEKASANGVATLGADSKILDSQMPDLAITDTFVVASEVAMLAVVAETGDVAVRTDENKSYI